MEIAKNKQWCSLPTELVHLIAEMTGCVKLRDGCIVSQISKDDPRRQVITTIPKILISSYQDRDDEGFLSKVESVFERRRQIPCTREGYTISEAEAAIKTQRYYYNFIDTIYFEIVSIFSQTPSRRRFINLDDTEYITIDDIYKYVTYSVNVNSPPWSRLGCHNEETVIVECDGTATHVLCEY